MTRRPAGAWELLYDKLAPGEKERFAGQTYTVHSALDMLVRRLSRRTVGMYWRRVSKLSFCDFVPDHSLIGSNGATELVIPESCCFPSQRAGRNGGRKRSPPTWRSSQVLVRHREWILPFVLTYPHRANRHMSGVIDAVYADRADLTAV